MAIMLAINLVIKGLSYAWDTLNVTVEEQKQKVDELQASYDGLKSEYDTLSQKQDLTDAEKKRLDYLERRLELDEKILEIETKKLYQNKVGTDWTDIFDGDSLKNKQYAEENALSSDSFKNLSRKYQNQLNAYNSNHENGYINLETRNIENLTEMYDDLLLKQADFLENRQDAQDAIDSGMLSGDDLAIAEEQLNYWDDAYKSVSLMVEEISKLSLVVDSIVAKQVLADYVQTSQLNAVKATVNEIYANYIDADYVSARYATISSLNAATARISTIESNYVKASTIEALNAKIKTLEADLLEVNNLHIGSVSLGLGVHEGVNVVTWVYR